jgi:uncharacterized CHY-type Zn-finger protein
MGNTVTYLPVRDLKVIRIVCHHKDCRAVTELHPAKVEAAMKKTGQCCPVCDKPFNSPSVEGGTDMVTTFAKCVLAMTELIGRVGIELPVVQSVDAGNVFESGKWSKESQSSRFLLSELKVVRLICGKCKVVSEMTVSRMASHVDPAECPVCGDRFCSSSDNPFRMLGNAIEMLAKETGVAVEFVLPAEPDAE